MDGVEFREVSFGHARKTPILDRFTLTVDAGACVALVGATGAGKTTVLKLVNRLLVPDAGDVRVEGRDTREWDPIRLRRSVGYVIQDVGLFPHLTVADNIGDTGTAAVAVTVAQRLTHIGDLDGASNVQKGRWDAFGTITVHDAAHQPVANASVNGVWSSAGSASCSADSLGVCTIALYGLPNSTMNTTFTVHSVISGAATYSAAGNHDHEGETDGTRVTIRRK
jgi:ABC-type Fe3+/spermidine/putrescine transport system ATPase subunit